MISNTATENKKRITAENEKTRLELRMMKGSVQLRMVSNTAIENKKNWD
jgi:hypothetical protein